METMAAVSAREAGAGQSERLAKLYQRHAPDLARLAYLLTGDRALAEDLTQEAFVRMIGRFQDLRRPEAFDWYLRKTLVNLVNSYFRRLKVERAYLASEARDPLPSPAPDVETRQEQWRRLQRLPERQRVAIVLRYYEDLTEVQTAELMSCPVGTVKSLVSRGLARLRGIVGAEGE